MYKLSGKFQSTLPAWGATSTICIERTIVTISIHAPRVGSDYIADKDNKAGATFQSTLPAWGATLQGNILSLYPLISIHAPRVGSDSVVWN